MGGINMTAKIIALNSKQRESNDALIEDDFTTLFRAAVSDKQKHDTQQGEEDYIIKSAEEVAERCRVAMNTLLLQERAIDSHLFRCVMHVSRVIADAVEHTPKSFYATDYYLKAIKTDKPSLLREGGDMCYLICTFFPERANRRCMTVKDCEQLGTQLYYRYYEESKNTLGLCMGDHFKTMILIAQECVYRL
jgi:hypothetical protein